MALRDIDVFSIPEAEDVLSPQFDRVLKGFDPEQVADYVATATGRIEELERRVEELSGERETARHAIQAAREEAYRAVAERMADVLSTADADAERVRHEARDMAKRHVADARAHAEQILREAETDAAKLRTQGEDAMRVAQAETERILGGLARRRDALLDELRDIEGRLGDVMRRVALITGGADGEPAPAAPRPTLKDAGDSDAVIEGGVDEMLATTQGFDLVVPEVVAERE